MRLKTDCKSARAIDRNSTSHSIGSKRSRGCGGPDCRVLLLARDRGPEPAVERVQKSLARFIGPEQVAGRVRSCEVIVGDLTNPATLGHSRLDEATHVLHLASVKKLTAQRLHAVLPLAI
jgi:hypothetical protein